MRIHTKDAFVSALSSAFCTFLCVLFSISAFAAGLGSISIVSSSDHTDDIEYQALRIADEKGAPIDSAVDWPPPSSCELPR